LTTTTSEVAGPTDSDPVERISKSFYAIWLGQFLSMIGSQLTAFALGVWLFQSTGSVLNFTQLMLCTTLPALIMMPWSGMVADQWDKRRILIAAEAIALVCTACMATLFALGRFEVWHLYALQVVLSFSMGFQAPTANAVITSLVPKSQFGRASGMYQIASAVSQFGAPLMAAPLLAVIGITGILVVDGFTFAIALLGVVLARVSRYCDAERSGPATVRSPLKDIRWAVDFLRERPTMARIYIYRIMGAFFTGMVLVLITPIVLSNHSAQVLAWVTTCGAIGALASGLVLVAWGGLKRWHPLILSLNLIQGIAIACAGLNNSVIVLCFSAFFVMMCSSLLAAVTSAIWRSKVPRDRQGNFAALQQAIGLTILPLSAVVGGLLAHFVFEPAFAPGGYWFETVGSWFGTGAGRATSFLFFVIGLAAIGISLVSLSDRRLYRFEEEVKDAI
jgi:MFS family permease